MKLTGSKRKGQHLQKNIGDIAKEPKNSPAFPETIIIDKKTEKKGSTKRRALVFFLTVLAVASLSVYFYVQTALSTRPPVKLEPRPDRITHEDLASPTPSAQPIDAQSLASGIYNRDTAKYTFLVLATDAEGGNTDVIIVVSFDTTLGALEVVSIPRDTLVNVSWSLKKANSIYASMRQRHGWEERSLDNGMSATVETFADLLGFEVDYWVLVDMRAFVALVDAIDGVEFDVPVNMNYTDTAGGLSIQYSRGLQRLSGKQALEVLRYRSGYSDADVSRINTQQDFLMSAAQQILAKRNSLSVNELASIILRYVKTDIDLSSLIWFGNQFIKINANSINFSIMPGNYQDYVGNQSYVTILLEEWLELINDKLNPYVEEVKPDSVSILTRGSDRYLYVTDGNRQGDSSWGSYSTGYISSISEPSGSGTSGNSSIGGEIPAYAQTTHDNVSEQNTNGHIEVTPVEDSIVEIEEELIEAPETIEEEYSESDIDEPIEIDIGDNNPDFEDHEQFWEEPPTIEAPEDSYIASIEPQEQIEPQEEIESPDSLNEYAE